MKKTKYTIGATALVLAVVGAFSTKASNKVKFFTGYTFNGSPEATTCRQSGTRICSDADGNILYTAATKALNTNIKTIRTIS